MLVLEADDEAEAQRAGDGRVDVDVLHAAQRLAWQP
jgi:hypothetical protein